MEEFKCYYQAQEQGHGVVQEKVIKNLQLLGVGVTK